LRSCYEVVAKEEFVAQKGFFRTEETSLLPGSYKVACHWKIGTYEPYLIYVLAHQKIIIIGHRNIRRKKLQLRPIPR
jgi:hypothetical protein